MKTNELRVGNWAHDTWDNIERKINPIDLVNLESDPEEFKPIEITEEWLIKLGFECLESMGEKYYTKDLTNDMCLYWNTHGNSGVLLDTECMQCYNQVVDIEIIQELKYVHQIQNIWFVFTGEEIIL